MKYSKGPLTATDGSCAVLVHLHDYYQFITENQKGERRLRKEIFESNVRDYEGDVDVNEDIHQTLDKPLRNEDFWWFNNGVTVLTTEVTSSGEQLTIKDPQIVNGLQTSVEISRHFTTPNPKSRKRIPLDKRNILVRVVKCTDESRNRIIKATNYQTKIPITSLLAMSDPFQENIEVYLKSRDYYYERRKNYYKNLKKPRGRIISVTFMAQSIIAIVLKEAYTARARPADLLREKEDYDRVFNKDYPLALYLTCVELEKRVAKFLRREAPLYVKGNENNIKFQLSMFAVMALTKALKPRIASIAQIDLEEVDSAFLKKCLKHVWVEFRQVQKKLKYISTKASKSPDFDVALVDRYRKILQDKISF